MLSLLHWASLRISTCGDPHLMQCKLALFDRPVGFLWFQKYDGVLEISNILSFKVG
jgi:hypothetical protein